jgi:hypothetical protein
MSFLRWRLTGALWATLAAGYAVAGACWLSALT